MDEDIDLEFLTVEKVVIARIILYANEIDNYHNIINDKVTQQLHNKMHRDGFVIKVKKIIGNRPLIIQKDTFAGECFTDVAVLVDVIEIHTGDIIYNCRISKVNKAGIFAKKKNGMIEILIPSDDLQDIDFSVFSKNDIINIEVVLSKATVYDDVIIIQGKLHHYLTIPPRRLLKKLNEPLYADNLTQEGLDNYSTNTKPDSVKIIPVPTLAKNVVHYEILGYPIGPFFQSVKVSNLKEEDIQISNAFNGLSPISGVKSLKSYELWEILRVFHVLEKSVKISSNNSELKMVVDSYAKSINHPAVKSGTDLMIVTDVNTDAELLKYLIDSLKNATNHLVMKIPPVTTAFLLQLSYILRISYKSLYLYKPMISNFLDPNYYIIASKFSNADKTLVKDLESLYTKVKDQTDHIVNLASNLSIEEIPNNYILQFRVFNDLMYRSMGERYIDVLTSGVRNMSDKNLVSIVEKEKEKITDRWLKKMKL